MKIEIKDQVYDVNAKEMRVVFSGVVTLDEFVEQSGHRNNLIEKIESHVVSKLSHDIIAGPMGEAIMEKIDLDSIVKRIQLKVVAGLGSERSC